MNLAQHFTPPSHARLLIRQICPFINGGKNISGVDLGSGQGALLYPAIQTWKKSSFLGVDISEPLYSTIRLHFPSVQFHCLDLLNESSLRSRPLSDLAESCDVAVCNPPFLEYRNDTFFRQLCRNAGMMECRTMSSVTSDIMFLLHNLRLLKAGGTLGIIIPDGIVAGKRFQSLRQSLLSNHRVEAVIQLPDNSFPGIETRTHILILRKGMKPAENVRIMQSDTDGITGEFGICTSELEQRMDYSQRRWKRAMADTGKLTLEDIGADIQRGSKSRAFFENSRIGCFHTTELPIAARQINLRKSRPLNFRMAESRDILVARVGKRCIGRVALINEGNLPITDCVYRIRVPYEWVTRTWCSMISEYAQNWFSAHSYGICARVISKADLLRFPIA
ncbi:MAG: N-6 DNA methylase [Gammaproteobacteria bacterium]|nr:N-6 DNA methylase [Gammaproteobacteria bacterium]